MPPGSSLREPCSATLSPGLGTQLSPASAQVFPTRFGSQCGLNTYRMGNYRETKSWREVVSGKGAATHRVLK